MVLITLIFQSTSLVQNNAFSLRKKMKVDLSPWIVNFDDSIPSKSRLMDPLHPSFEVNFLSSEKCHSAPVLRSFRSDISDAHSHRILRPILSLSLILDVESISAISWIDFDAVRHSSYPPYVLARGKTNRLER